MKKTIYKKIPLDLFVVLIWIMATILFIVSPVLKESYIRIILGITMILFIPGYVLIAALFPKADDLGYAERIVLSIGLSIAIIPLIGLLSNFTFGISLIYMLTSEIIYSIFLMIITAYRREKLSEDTRFSISFRDIYRDAINSIKPKDRICGILTFILVVITIIAIGTMYYVITAPKMGERFTEFYVLDERGESRNYSTDLKLGNPTIYMVGISNREQRPINYTLQVVLDKDILISKEIFIGYNEIWKDDISIVPNRKGTNMVLEFWLFKGNDIISPYRSLHLWVNST